MPSLGYGLMNSAQVLWGARKPGTIKTYVTSGVIESPRVFLHNATTLAAAMASGNDWATQTQQALTDAHIISFVGGAIEFDGKRFTLDTGPAPADGGINNVGNSNIDLDLLSDYLCVGEPCPEYVLAAVPRYDEPASQAEAEAMGVNYFITMTSQGEFEATFFTSSSCNFSACKYGSFYALEQAVRNGCASCEDAQAYYDCVGERDCPTLMLCIRGVAFVLAEVCDMSNCCNPAQNLNRCQFEQLIATYGGLPSIRLRPITTADTGTPPDPGVTDEGVYTLNEFFGSTTNTQPFTGDTVTGGSNSSFRNGVGIDYGNGNGPGSELWRIQSIEFYPSSNLATGCEQGKSLMYPSSMSEVRDFVNILTAPLGTDPCNPTCGHGWSEADIRIIAREYEMPCCDTPPTQQGDQPELRRMITKQQTGAAGPSWLGRINPLYKQSRGASLRLPYRPSASALHWYADPVSLVRFRISDIDPDDDPLTTPNVVIDTTSVTYQVRHLIG